MFLNSQKLKEEKALEDEKRRIKEKEESERKKQDLERILHDYDMDYEYNIVPAQVIM